MTKKVTAILLALLLGLSSMITVFAEEVNADAATEAVTENPAEVTAKAGENAVFSVKTIGEVRSYQWQVSKDGGKKWTDLNPKTYGATETLTLEVKESYDGYLYRCEVTFADYKVDHSAPAKLSLRKDTLYPAAVFESEAVNGVTVHVDAPEGALPEGTMMVVDPVDLRAAQAAIDRADDLNGSAVAAVDITFFDVEGGIVEPEKEIKVTMSSEAIAKAANPYVVHLDANAEELQRMAVAPEKIDAEFDAQKAIFSADQFSVYVVVEGDDIITPQITYHFLDGEGKPYPFLNTAGQTVTEQIIKNGEKLQEVPAPGLLNNQAFNGWYFFTPTNTSNPAAGGTYGAMVDFDQTISVTETKDLYIKAHYGSVIYVTFWQYAAGKVVLERKQVPQDETDGKYKIDITSVSVPAPSTTLKFMGWSLTPGTDASETDGDTPGSRPLLANNANGVVEFAEDTDVYPVYYTGRWIVFVSAATGMGASYTEAYFLPADSANASAAKPTNPTMTGYTFDGWFTTPENDYTAGENSGSFDFNTSFADLDAYTNERGEVVLYGHWKGGSTTYVVVYWKQQVSNSKTATDAQKTYDYAGQTDPINGTTGQAVSPTDAQKNAEVGFEYKRYKLTDGEGNAIDGIAADGSSILHVYFDRKMIYMRFREDTNASYNGSWTSSSYATTYYGLYGQTWSQAGYNHDWPSPGSSGSGWNARTYRWIYYTTGNDTKGQVYLGQFVLPDDVRDTTRTEIRLYREETSTRTYYFYLQNADETWPTSTTITGIGSGNGTFYFSDKYEGFKVVAYRIGNNGTWQTVSSTTNSDGTHTYSPASLSNNTIGNNSVSIRYEREKYEIKYLNPLNESAVLDPETLPFGASLSNKKPASTATVNLGNPGYEWNGKWYKDKACTVEFDFATETMPLGGTKVYAGKTPKYFYVKIDPNGGELQTGQATWRWVIYGDDTTYTYDNIKRDYIEYKGSGTAYYYYYDEFEEDRREDIWNYEYMASNPRLAYYTSQTVPYDWDQTIRVDGVETIVHHAGSEAQAWLDTATKYTKELDAYALIGWYDITDGVENMKPFKTGTAITRDTVIQAQWRRTGEYIVKYSDEAVDANGNPLLYPEGAANAGERVQGSDAPNDTAKYADKSDSAIMDKLGTVPAGYSFKGWYYNGKVYEPGDVFQVLASLSDENKLVWIYPVLEAVESLPVEVIDVTFDANGGVFTADATTQLNDIIATIKEKSGEGTYLPSIKNNEDGSITLQNLKLNESFILLTADAVANGIEVDGAMVVGRGYRLKEWNSKADGSGTSYPLNVTVGVDDKTPIPNKLYAIWEELFYAYHEATGKFATLVKGDSTTRMAMTTGYDAENNKYTDYYYGGFAVYAASDKAATGVTFANNGDATGTIADSYWTRVTAAKNASLWDATDTGAVYYIREVSKDYLASPAVATVRGDYGNGDLTSVSVISVVDTTIYRAGGMYDGESYKRGTFALSFTTTQLHGDEGSTTLTSGDLFKDSEGGKLDGYLIINAWSTEAGTYTMTPYWITYDNVTVRSNQLRKITINSDGSVSEAAAP